jgi:hypothetical protein
MSLYWPDTFVKNSRAAYMTATAVLVSSLIEWKKNEELSLLDGIVVTLVSHTLLYTHLSADNNVVLPDVGYDGHICGRVGYGMWIYDLIRSFSRDIVGSRHGRNPSPTQVIQVNRKRTLTIVVRIRPALRQITFRSLPLHNPQLPRMSVHRILPLNPHKLLHQPRINRPQNSRLPLRPLIALNLVLRDRIPNGLFDFALLTYGVASVLASGTTLFILG